MEELYRYIGSDQNLWNGYRFTSRTSLNVTEVWLTSTSTVPQPDLQNCTVVHRCIDEDQLISWSRCTVRSSKYTEHQGRYCALRIVWIDIHVRDRYRDVSSPAFEKLVDVFGHETARHSCEGSAAGAMLVPTSFGGMKSGYVGIHPKLMMTWTFDPAAATTSIICNAEPLKITKFKRLIEQSFWQQFLPSEMTPLLLCSIVCSLEIGEDHDLIKHYIRAVEVRTGYHEWQNRIENAADGDLFQLAEKVSGYRMKLASCIRKLEILSAMTSLIQKWSSLSDIALEPSSIPTTTSRGENLKSCVEALEARMRMQHIDSGFLQARIETQLEALFHLIAKHDAMTNHQVAIDSKLIAIAAQRDASIMKSLAVVAFFFLPGTFVSSLFSMPLFDWDCSGSSQSSAQVNWRSRLVIYCAVTIPLMVVTFMVWGYWSNRKVKQFKEGTRSAKGQLHCNMLFPLPQKLERRKPSMLDKVVIHPNS